MHDQIKKVVAHWLRCPIATESQHVSDFGRIQSFDCVLVEIHTAQGLVGHGEAKAAVGSSGDCAALASCINHEFAPLLVDENPSDISRIWEKLYNGTRDHYAVSRGRTFPTLGRRGLHVCAISAIDTALWDILGKRLNCSVTELLGGACRQAMPAYASGGWADREKIGEQLLSYTAKGFGGVKMRVGVIDGSPRRSAERVWAAREALGDDVKLMVDAHGTFSTAEAKRFCQLTEQADLFWFEEPCSADNLSGTAEVRLQTATPIALGESEFTRFDLRDALLASAADVLQPDPAIVGGITEMRRIAALAESFQVALAPHCWGSAFSFRAALAVAFASPAAIILEFSLGANPLLHELVEEATACDPQGNISCPSGPGLGLTLNREFVNEFSVPT